MNNPSVTKVFPLLKTEVARMFTICASIKEDQERRARAAAFALSEKARLRRMADHAKHPVR